MQEVSRRDFVKLIGSAAAALLLGRSVVAAGTFSASPFEFLVVGDSLVWGQGLEEKDKFYSLTADWLRREFFGGQREVNLKVKAHSGATFRLAPEDAAAFKRAGRDETHYYKGEVNVAFPSMWKQVETTAAEYKSAGVTDGADLVMLTGGITDVTVEKVLDPYGNNAELPELIEKHCRDGMFEFLEHVADHNPKALIAVIGYFPMISEKSRGSRVFNAWLVTLGFPSIIRHVANNPLVRRLFFQKLRKKAIKRSQIWLAESNRNLRLAVAKLNKKLKTQRAVFISSPLTADNAAEAPNTLLFRMRKSGPVEDPLYTQRNADCKSALAELKKATGINRSIKRCSIAAVGHPDPAGARAYAEAIKTTLGPLVRENGAKTLFPTHRQAAIL
jgi:hypothetical protein